MDALPADAKMNLTVNEAKSRQTLDYSTENIKADAPAHKCVHHYGRGHQYTNFQSSHQLASYLQNQSTREFARDVLRLNEDSQRELPLDKSVKEKQFHKARMELLRRYQTKQVFDLTKKTAEIAMSKTDKAGHKAQFPNKKGGVSSDWAPELTGGKELYKHNNEPSYHERCNRENLVKTQMKQNHDRGDLLPLDLVTQHNRSATRM